MTSTAPVARLVLPGSKRSREEEAASGSRSASPEPVPIQLPSRKRVYRACEVCRRKKVKCNGEKPCSHCSTFAEDCHYAASKDRNAYSRRYVESLETRLADLEQAFLVATEGQRSRMASLFNSGQITAANDNVESLMHNEAIRRYEKVLDVCSLVNSQQQHYSGALKVDANQNLRYIGPSSAVALIAQATEAVGSSAGRKLERATGRPSYKDMPWFGSGGEAEAAIVRQEEVGLPSGERCRVLLDTFFRRVHPIFPVLCENAFREGIERLLDGEREGEGVDAAFLGVVFSVLACGERAEERPGGSWVQAGSLFYARSQSLALRCVSETRLDLVQLHALQAFYMAASNCSARAWILTGQAMRLGLDLGLQRNLNHERLSLSERATRIRVWWCLYMQDRILGITIGRPFGIEDDNIDTPLPSAAEGEAGMGDAFLPLMPGFNALIALSRIAGRIARTVTRLQLARQICDVDEAKALMESARAHEATLDAWQESLPNTTLSIQSCIAFSSLHSTRMLLQQALLTGEKDDKMDLARCTQTALHIIQAADSVAELIPPSHFLLEYSHQLLVSGGFLALNAAIRPGANTTQLLNGADEALAAFRTLERSFPGAKDHRKALVNVVHTVRERVSETPTKRRRAVTDLGPKGAEAAFESLLSPTPDLLNLLLNLPTWDTLV